MSQNANEICLLCNYSGVFLIKQLFHSRLLDMSRERGQKTRIGPGTFFVSESSNKKWRHIRLKIKLNSRLFGDERRLDW